MNDPAAAWLTAKNAATPEMMAQVAITLRVAASDASGVSYILAPFTPLHDGERWWLAAITTPPPSTETEAQAFTRDFKNALHRLATSPADPDANAPWRPSGDVILIDPKYGAMQTFDRDAGALIEPVDAVADSGPARLYTNGLLLARDWVTARSDWLACLDAATVPGCTDEPPGQPGIALCGDLASVADLTPIRRASRVMVDDPRIMRVLTKMLLESARLPTVDAMPARLRSVA